MYNNAFKQETRNLVNESTKGTLPDVYYRDTEIERLLSLLDQNKSVLVQGPQGVGKTAVIYGVAHAMRKRKKGGLRQLSTTVPLVGTKYIGEWQTKLTRIVEAARKKKAILYFDDVWNLSNAGKSANDPTCFLDSLRPYLEQGKLQLIGEITPETLRTMQKIPSFVSLFLILNLSPLSGAHAGDILSKFAQKQNIDLSEKSLRSVMQLTSRFLPSRPQPGPGISLIDQIRHYRDQKEQVGEPVSVTREFIEKVFSIYTGLPRFIISKTEVIPARKIREYFQQMIIGQGEAIDAVVETIALYKAGLNDPERPIGTFLFVGPTGVGKTELARSIARFLFGSANRLLRFDLSEFKDYSSFEMLLGDPQNPEMPAKLIDPVKSQPFQVVLFDELEKAHANVWDLFLQLLDDGRLTPAGGEVVNFRNTIIIATSNVGTHKPTGSLGFGAGASNEQDDRRDIQRALEQVFRPEFLNRFGHIVTFHRLTKDQVRQIADLEIKKILKREGILERNLMLDIDEEAIDEVISETHESRYGARALKREIQKRIILPLAVTLMEKPVEQGSILKITLVKNQIRVKIVDTPESRRRKEELKPVRTETGKKLTKIDIEKLLQKARADLDAIGQEMDEKALIAACSELQNIRNQPDFWKNYDGALQVLLELDLCQSLTERLERLRTWCNDIEKELKSAQVRTDIEKLSRRMPSLTSATEKAYLELALIGKDNIADTIVSLFPMGANSRKLRDLMATTIMDWAVLQHYKSDWLHEPLSDTEPVILLLSGNYAYGYLRLETGVHQLISVKNNRKTKSAVKCQVIPVFGEKENPIFGEHRALKLKGQFGGKVRSRLACGHDLVLQNSLTLSENKDLAISLISSWKQYSRTNDEIVRRIELGKTFLLRDFLSGINTGKRDSLTGSGYHQILCTRLHADAASEK